MYANFHTPSSIKWCGNEFLKNVTDGTTDVTRTFTFGSPTAEQKDMYTRVLMGFIDLASLSFPDYVDDTRIDIVARQHLYAAGVDYLHGTGHGIGAFLGVHESKSIFIR